jgi:hypothetical protein
VTIEVEPSAEPTFVGHKDPTIQVLDCLMGQGKTTWLLDHISAEVVTDQAHNLTDLSQRWLVIVPTLKEVDRFVNKFESLGALFYFPNTEVDDRKTWHLQTLVNQGRNIVATHSLFKHLTPSVYRAIERQGYNLVVDEEIEVVRPYGLSKAKVDTLLNKDCIVHDPATRRLTWNSNAWPTKSFPFKSDIPKLCDAGSLVLTNSGLLIVELPAEFLRCFDEVHIATFMFDGAPLCAYLKDKGFRIERYTIAKDSKRRGREGVPKAS